MGGGRGGEMWVGLNKRGERGGLGGRQREHGVKRGVRGGGGGGGGGGKD